MTPHCYRCGTGDGYNDTKTRRDKVAWHACFWLGWMVLVTWAAIPFLDKKLYCARCGGSPRPRMRDAGTSPRTRGNGSVPRTRRAGTQSWREEEPRRNCSPHTQG